MRSITARFTALIILAVLLSVAVVGSISMMTVRTKADQDAVSIINLTCRTEAQRINTTLESIEQSVDTEVSYALDQLESTDRFFADEQYRAAYTEKVEGLFLDVANDTNGAVSFYFRYNAEDIPSTQGFLYGRDGAGADFAKIELTDLSLYDPTDDEHVGWYYIPLRNGGPTWMAPYHNKNLGIYMISYVVPLYKDDRFIGVIGMDVDFDVIVNQLRDISPYESGYACLINDDGTVLYHPTLEYGTILDGTDPTLPNFANLRHDESSDGALVPLDSRGKHKLMAYQKLQNDMNLVLVADESDINADRNHLLTNLLVAALIIIALFTVAGIASGRLLFRPLRDLTDAAGEVSQGNLDVSLPDAGPPEIRTLIGAYRTTVDRMREQLAIIDDMAHHDGLTGLLNKSSYDERIQGLGERIADGTAQFALVMIDANCLKDINDTYGHERGDAYLCQSAKLIKQVFEGCKAYRIGGDEFVVVAEGPEALVRLDGWMADLAARSADPATLCSADPEQCQDADGAGEQPVSLAYGAATFDAARDRTVADVFTRADMAMYSCKQEMKAGTR